MQVIHNQKDEIRYSVQICQISICCQRNSKLLIAIDRPHINVRDIPFLEISPTFARSKSATRGNRRRYSVDPGELPTSRPLADSNGTRCRDQLP